MLPLNIINAAVAQVDLFAFLAILISGGALIINFISVRQSARKIKDDNDRLYATKELLDQKINTVDKQIVMIDKELCSDRANNLREHDAIKDEFLRTLKDIKDLFFSTINKK